MENAPDLWNDGESAFPYVAEGNQGPFVHPGMTLRQWYAGQALAGEIASWSTIASVTALVQAAAERGVTIEEQTAFDCFKMADAMIAESKK